MPAPGLLEIIRSSRAFAPVLEASRGILVSIFTLIALTSLDKAGIYCSCEVFHTATRDLRALLAPRGITVVAVRSHATAVTSYAGVDMLSTDSTGIIRCAFFGVESGAGAAPLIAPPPGVVTRSAKGR